MRWLINYIRSCFCKHDWELLLVETVYETEINKLPIGKQWIYRCKKCGYVKKYKSY